MGEELEARSAAAWPPFDSSDCPKCMSMVLRLLLSSPKGCPAANATMVSSSNAGRVPTAYCDTLLPKRRACVAYSFGLEGTWDFDKVCAPLHRRTVSRNGAALHRGNFARSAATVQPYTVAPVAATVQPCTVAPLHR